LRGRTGLDATGSCPMIYFNFSFALLAEPGQLCGVFAIDEDLS
jgi:hypothetical protein